MDYRNNLRAPINMKLLVYRNGLPMAIGRIRDVSRTSLFVEADSDNVHLDEILEVELLPRTSTHIDRCRFKTVVTRRTRDGFALELASNSASGFNALAKLIDSALLTRQLGRLGAGRSS